MKIDNVGMVVGFVASIVVFEIREATLWLEVIGAGVGTFIGWQLGCLADIIWANRHVTDPDPERNDADIPTFRKYSDLTADEQAFIAKHEAMHKQYQEDRQRNGSKPYIED